MAAVQGRVDGRPDRLRGILALPGGVEAAESRGKCAHALVLDVIPHRSHGIGSLVGERESRAFRIRHREVAVKAVGAEHTEVAGVDRHHQRREEAGALLPETEEVAERHLDARRLLAVPVRTQHQVAQVVRAAEDAEVHVSHDAGAVELRELERLPGGDRPEVGVGTGLIEAGDARGRRVGEPHHAGERRPRELLRTQVGHRAEADDKQRRQSHRSHRDD